MSIIKWEEPPARKYGGGSSSKWTKVIEQLKKRPGEWALVAEGVGASLAGHLKRRGLEAVSRNAREGGANASIYARWPEGGES
ncbi:hypothetical protein [Microbacterium sp. No. 7]|uniref:hypothetical protein n=1 Tax=Microbacterium sp. No. 7 TaxID=1714373 RepID=UPI0006ECF6F6|nr:hypothetical protein [Microbacterium sp. No. 7]ALJ19541.1 hypothetical protein AOA12_06305 [Microbacterium sp. No. 7]